MPPIRDHFGKDGGSGFVIASASSPNPPAGALLQAAALRLPDRALAFTGVINGSACSFASRTILSRLVFASRADFSVLMICCAARAVTSLFFSPLVGFGLKTPSGIWCRMIYSYKRKRPGFPDLPQFASMASASTSVVKDQKRFP
jgi:hypothetical protein